MKRFALTICIALILQGCGNPADVAYTRGLWIQKEADSDVEKVGRIDNSAKSKYFKAIEQFNSAIHFNENHSLAYYRRGVCRARLEQYDSAAGDFSRTVALDPHNAEGWVDRATVYKEMQEFGRAVEDYDIADKLAPGDERVYHGRSYCRRFSGDLKGALLDAQKAAELRPSPDNYCAIATIQRSLGNLKDMDAAYAKAIELNPHRIATYQVRGFSNFTAGRYDAALKDFQTALKGSNWTGNETPYAVIFGMFASRLGSNKKEASVLLDTAVKRLSIPIEIDKRAKNAQVADAWPTPAIQYFHGDITQEKFLRSAQGNNGKMTEAQCYLGIANLLNGEKQLATKHLQWVSENGRKDYVEYEIAHELLKKLSSITSGNKT